MSQVQALLTATDQALDALTAYQRELEDVRAHLAFVLRSLDQAVQRALWAAGQRLSVLEGSENDDALRLVARRIEALGALQMELAARSSSWRCCMTAAGRGAPRPCAIRRNTPES